MNFQIIDLDGCISDDRWRRTLLPVHIPHERLRDEHYHEYHRSAIMDEPANLTKVMMDASIIVLTSRPLRYREMTREWLANKANIIPTFILMRNPADRRSSVQVKRQHLDWLLNPNLLYGVTKSNIIHAMDDRDDICEMYREVGLKSVEVVRIGGEEGH